jgi:hypothetical protein
MGDGWLSWMRDKWLNWLRDGWLSWLRDAARGAKFVGGLVAKLC